jgi:hypothetical protein
MINDTEQAQIFTATQSSAKIVGLIFPGEWTQEKTGTLSSSPPHRFRKTMSQLPCVSLARVSSK